MKLSIYIKMMMGYVIIIAIMILVNIYTLSSLESISETTHVALDSDVHTIDIAKRMQTLVDEQDRNLRKFLITRDQTYHGLFVDLRTRYIGLVDTLLTHAPDIHEVVIINELGERDINLVALVGQVPLKGPLPGSVEPLIDDVLQTVRHLLQQLILHNQSSIGTAMTLVQSRTDKASQIVLVLVGLTLIGAVCAAFIVTRSITTPIHTLIRGTEQIARGVFDPIHVSSRDEIARLAEAVNSMSESLKQISEMKAEMMQHISHELRSPLATMSTAHQLLAGGNAGPVTEEQVRLLAAFKNNIDKLVRFSHDFLDLAKMEAGMMEYRLQPVELLPILQPLIEDARLIASQKDITVTLNAGSLPTIHADPEKLSQAFNNLLSNAIKYTEKRGHVTVAAEHRKASVVVTVRDSGIGIPAEELPMVFEKFYRARNVAHGRQKGTGIGLALVRAIAEGHSGSVFVTSTVGVGSTFGIELPVKLNSNDRGHPVTVETNRNVS